jgi:deoxyhypusine synthase
MEPVKDLKITKNSSVNDIVRGMRDAGGFTAKNLAIGIDILDNMTKDANSLNFLSFTADIVSTGTRGVLRDMVKNNMFDVVITTCGTLDHDIARCFKDYYEGRFEADDSELAKKGINRLGNVFIPNESYGIILEEKLADWLREIHSEKKEVSTHELCWELGRRLDEESILYWCWKNKIPVIIPGITDGSVGYQIWQFAQDKDFKINLLKDETLLSDMIWNAKRSGALIVGGGISKHHVIWWNQFKKGLDYAVYVSTAVEWDGSASGARPREAVSWGKIKPEAKFSHIDGDATVILPIIYASLLQRQ